MLTNRFSLWFACVLPVLFLAGCSSSGGRYFQNDGPSSRSEEDILRSVKDVTPRVEQPHRAANRPYTVLGKRYYPVTGDKPMREEGIASWYGTQFHGKKTSIGERYDMYSMSAAHPTMELPSYARVTNLSNGRSVIVRVNDRGPFLGGRIIDMSYAAAIRLGYHKKGTARVRVERITRRQIASSSIPEAPRIQVAEEPAPSVYQSYQPQQSAIHERIVIASAAAPRAAAPSASGPGVRPNTIRSSEPEFADPMNAVVLGTSDSGMAPIPSAASSEPEPLSLDVGPVTEGVVETASLDAPIVDNVSPAMRATAAGANPSWSAQIGAFRTEVSAQQTAAHAEMMLSEQNANLPVRIVKDGELYRVLVGRSNDADTARRTAKTVGDILGQSAFAILK